MIEMDIFDLIDKAYERGYSDAVNDVLASVKSMAEDKDDD